MEAVSENPFLVKNPEPVTGEPYNYISNKREEETFLSEFRPKDPPQNPLALAGLRNPAVISLRVLELEKLGRDDMVANFPGSKDCILLIDLTVP
jgi:hypothetical protein